MSQDSAAPARRQAPAVAEGDLLWEPPAAFAQGSVMAEYQRWLAEGRGLRFTSYDDLWRWSVTDLEAFWASIAAFFDVRFTRPPERLLASREMPGARWGEGGRLNYAENAFRFAADDRPALLYASETQPLAALSWRDLRARVASVAAALRAAGVGVGDRVVGYLPNVPEAVIAFLASASLGAVWACCSPDFGVDAVLDRFGPLRPTVLFAVDGSTYNGRFLDRRPVVQSLVEGLPTLARVVLVPRHPESEFESGASRRRVPALAWDEAASRPDEPLSFVHVPFEHPLWVLFSSGTTGLPKALVHGHGGVVLEHVKALGLHSDLRPGDRAFWYTSTGWMMWNFIVGGLLVGATPVLYDGSASFPSLDVLWQLARDARLALFGTSAAYITACRAAGLAPGERFDLSALRSIGSTGSPLPPEGFAWAYESVKQDLWLASISGGTDVVSAFLVGCPTLPVHAGEIQCRALGASVEAFDEEGRSVVEQTGELVITAPLPSMPIYVWDDPDGAKYRASYFDTYPGVWRHGDWLRLTRRGSAVIQGRSDSTLNRHGIRIGTSEIYRAVERIAEVTDSLVVGLELPNGGYYMPLFVVLAEGATLDAALEQRIRESIRQSFSPRHVPDEVLAVPAIPRTLSDKKMEVPVKRLFMGAALEAVAKPGATRAPEALTAFAELARRKSPLLAPTA